jgi:hypothetical protein
MVNESLAVLRLESGKARASLYMTSIMQETAVKEIVDPLKKYYQELGASQGFIDSIRVEQKGGLKIDLIIDHPIAEWLEYGTEPHKIDVNEAEFLRFQFRKTSSWFNSKASDSGDWFFGESVDHPGFPGYKGIAIMLESLIQNYKNNVILKTNQFLERSRMK